MTAVGLEAVIIFDYLGYFDLSSENALEVILALHFFQMRDEMKLCTDFVFNEQLLTINNVWEFRSSFNKLDLGLANEYAEKIDEFVKVCYFFDCKIFVEHIYIIRYKLNSFKNFWQIDIPILLMRNWGIHY